MEIQKLNDVINLFYNRFTDDNLMVKNPAVYIATLPKEIFPSLLQNVILCISVFKLNNKNDYDIVNELVDYIKLLYNRLENNSINSLEFMDLIVALFNTEGYFVTKLYKEGFNEQLVDDIYDTIYLFASIIQVSTSNEEAIVNVYSLLIKLNIQVFIPFYEKLSIHRLELSRVEL